MGPNAHTSVSMLIVLGKGLGCAASVSERIQALNNATHCDEEGRRIYRILPGVKIQARKPDFHGG